MPFAFLATETLKRKEEYDLQHGTDTAGAFTKRVVIAALIAAILFFSFYKYF